MYKHAQVVYGKTGEWSRMAHLARQHLALAPHKCKTDKAINHITIFTVKGR